MKSTKKPFIYSLGIIVSLLLSLMAEAQITDQTTTVTLPGTNAPTMGGRFDQPLTVNPGDHAVVMEYEAWFGPHAVSFYPNNEANPLLQSKDMLGAQGCDLLLCGYDSEGPEVISQHIDWLRYMGIDAVTLDDSNNGACIYDSSTIGDQVPGCKQWKSYWQQIGINNANIYRQWYAQKVPIKIIPLMDAEDTLVFTVDSDGKSALEKEIEYYGNLMDAHPNMNVVYEGKPLILLYVAVNQYQTLPFIQYFLSEHKDLADKYTFRSIGGLFDSQSQYWAPVSEQKLWGKPDPSSPTTPSGPTKIDSQYRLWSLGDRFNTTCAQCYRDGSVYKQYPQLYATYPFYPTYALNWYLNNGEKMYYVEDMAVDIATQSAQNNDGSNWFESNGSYYPDDSLRWDADKNYITLHKFMPLAYQLKPAFLFISQFNEFQQPDEGVDARTSDDIEPASALATDTEPHDSWGYSALIAVHNEVTNYRSAVK